MSERCGAVSTDRTKTCHMLKHPGRLHVTVDYRQFVLPDNNWQNQAPDPSLDVLRDAPDALRRIA